MGVNVDIPLLDAYLRGEDPALVSYEKVEQSPTQTTAIQRYLIAAESYRRQPALQLYYDIFRCARIVPLLFALDQALMVARRHVGGIDDRLARLARETKLDAFDAVLFEIVTAARYAQCPHVREVSFIKETAQQQPDLRVATESGVLYVECKRFDRSPGAAVDLRDAVRDKVRIILAGLEHINVSAVVEVIFKVSPADIADEDIARLAGVAIRTCAPVVTDKFQIDHRRLAFGPLQTCALYPSPQYFAERYGFLTDGEWQGIVPAMRAKFAGPSCLDAVSWEAAVKWRVANDKIIWRQKRLGYSLLFKGLDQLATPLDSAETVLHVCFERDSSLGSRQQQLMHFLETLRKQTEHTFGWVVFNELVINVSPQGRFDFVEHAHLLSGPKRTSVQPLVTLVFVPYAAMREGIGEFGVGVKMAPIDDEVAASQNPSEDP